MATVENDTASQLCGFGTRFLEIVRTITKSDGNAVSRLIITRRTSNHGWKVRHTQDTHFERSKQYIHTCGAAQ